MPRGTTPRQPARSGHCKTAHQSPPFQGWLQSSEATNRVRAPGPSPVGAPAESRGKKTLNPIAPVRVQEILKRLDTLYPDVTCALHHKSAWELLVATILSAQSTDVRVNMVTPELFRKYPTVQDLQRSHPNSFNPTCALRDFSATSPNRLWAQRESW